MAGKKDDSDNTALIVQAIVVVIGFIMSWWESTDRDKKR